jgi:hypothetical protein
VNPLIDGINGTQWNPDPKGKKVFAKPQADYQGQLDVDPDTHFPAVDLQIFGGVTTAQNPNRRTNMQGFVKSYYERKRELAHSRKIMNYFAQDKLPVLTSLASYFGVFNRWFSSIPGPRSAIGHSLTMELLSARWAWMQSIGTSGTLAFTSGWRLRAGRPSSITSTRPVLRKTSSTCSRISLRFSVLFRTFFTPAIKVSCPIIRPP